MNGHNSRIQGWQRTLRSSQGMLKNTVGSPGFRLGAPATQRSSDGSELLSREQRRFIVQSVFDIMQLRAGKRHQRVPLKSEAYQGDVKSDKKSAGAVSGDIRPTAQWFQPIEAEDKPKSSEKNNKTLQDSSWRLLNLRDTLRFGKWLQETADDSDAVWFDTAPVYSNSNTPVKRKEVKKKRGTDSRYNPSSFARAHNDSLVKLRRINSKYGLNQRLRAKISDIRPSTGPWAVTGTEENVVEEKMTHSSAKKEAQAARQEVPDFLGIIEAAAHYAEQNSKSPQKPVDTQGISHSLRSSSVEDTSPDTRRNVDIRPPDANYRDSQYAVIRSKEGDDAIFGIKEFQDRQSRLTLEDLIAFVHHEMPDHLKKSLYSGNSLAGLAELSRRDRMSFDRRLERDLVLPPAEIFLTHNVRQKYSRKTSNNNPRSVLDIKQDKKYGVHLESDLLAQDVGKYLHEVRHQQKSDEDSHFQTIRAYEWTSNLLSRNPRSLEDGNFFNPASEEIVIQLSKKPQVVSTDDAQNNKRRVPKHSTEREKAVAHFPVSDSIPLTTSEATVALEKMLKTAAGYKETSTDSRKRKQYLILSREAQPILTNKAPSGAAYLNIDSLSDATVRDLSARFGDAKAVLLQAQRIQQDGWELVGVVNEEIPLLTFEKDVRGGDMEANARDNPLHGKEDSLASRVGPLLQRLVLGKNEEHAGQIRTGKGEGKEKQ